MEYERIWAMPNHHTFRIKPIKKLLTEYVDDGIGWVNPFCGMEKMGEYTNDLNLESPADDHMDAKEWMERFKKHSILGILLDPPYSMHQSNEMYGGRKCNSLTPIYNMASDAIVPGGMAISFGWNSNGLGKKRGFEVIDGLIVPHGGHHNDTIVTVELKIGE